MHRHCLIVVRPDTHLDLVHRCPGNIRQWHKYGVEVHVDEGGSGELKVDVEERNFASRPQLFEGALNSARHARINPNRLSLQVRFYRGGPPQVMLRTVKNAEERVA